MTSNTESRSRLRSVVLLSGGLDSAANLAMCREHDSPVLALTLRYGQRAEEREVEAASQLAAYYSVPHQIVDLSWFAKLGTSALTHRNQTLPDLAPSKLDSLEAATQTARAVWVPNRNGLFLNVAAAFAESLGALQVVVGFNIEEAATFPDNTSEFLDASTRAFFYSTQNQVRAFSYTDRLNKTAIVQGLKSLSKSFPFEKIWSCYQGGKRPCGECESCRRLARALDAGGVR